MTLDAPELVRVSVCVLLVPTTTLPKATLVGLADKVAGIVPCIFPVRLVRPAQPELPSIIVVIVSRVVAAWVMSASNPLR